VVAGVALVRDGDLHGGADDGTFMARVFVFTDPLH
jgi:hypothetical protein